MSGNTSAVQFLLDKPFYKDIHIPNKNNKTPLQLATDNNHNDIIQLLQQHNTSPLNKFMSLFQEKNKTPNQSSFLSCVSDIMALIFAYLGDLIFEYKTKVYIRSFRFV